MHADVLIIGGGLAGLACAKSLADWQIDFQLLEATDRVGGRLRTDHCGGFQLDHGLHLLQTESPLCRQLLDYDALQLRPCDRGVLVRGQDGWMHAGDRATLERQLHAGGRAAPLTWPLADDGPAAVPAAGIAAIASQLAAALPAGTVQTQRSVQSVTAATVQTSDESEHRFGQLVIATEAPAAQRLLGGRWPEVTWQAMACLHFAAPQPPVDHRGLIVAADNTAGPISQLAVISNIAPSYAPASQALVSVAVDSDAVAALDDPDALESSVRAQLGRWFDGASDTWRLLRIYHIPYAVPVAVAGAATRWPEDNGPIVCGDYRTAPSIQGALQSGLQAAEAIRRRLG